MQRIAASVFLIVSIFVAGGGNLKAEDYSYVTDDELSLELKARQKDLERSTGRIEQMQQELDLVEVNIEQLKKELTLIEDQLSKKITALYKLSRNGKTFQYLITSDSAIAFFRRVQMLKRVITSEMDKKVEKNTQLVKAAEKQKKLKDQISSNTLFLEELHQAINELTLEQHKRELNRLP